MRNYFIPSGLRIGISRIVETNELLLTVGSEYSRTQHKGRIHVNEKSLAEATERLWKSIKTKKLQLIKASFDEIDWYDDHVDVYKTPSVSIKRGLRKAVIGHREHGSIPKDWEFNFSARFSDTTTSTPIMEVVKKTLSNHFTPQLEKNFKKAITPVLQKKKPFGWVETPQVERYNYY